DVRQALTRTRAGRDHVVMTTARHIDRLDLVAMQAHGAADGIFVGLARTEDTAALLVQRAGRHQVVQHRARGEGRVQLEQRLGPQAPATQALLHPAPDALVADADETLYVVCVVRDQPVAEVKDLHRLLLAP